MATRQSTTSQRRFARKCGCLNHDLFSNNQPSSLLQAQSISRRASYKSLLSRSLITVKIKYICNLCLEYSQEHFVHSITLESSFSDHDHSIASFTDNDSSLLSTDSDNCKSVFELTSSSATSPCFNSDPVSVHINEENSSITFENIISFLNSPGEWNALDKSTQDNLSKISSILGSKINSALYHEGRNMQEQQEYKNINIEKNKWISDRNPVVTGFINGVTGYSSNVTNERKVNAVVHILEQIYYARNIKLVTPYAFQRNLIAYSLTNSKLCTSLNGCWEPSGSYSTVHNYICSPTAPIKCPSGYVHCAIDNNQKVGKSSGRIAVASKVPVDVCTSVSNFLIDSEKAIQNNANLMPSEWQSENPSEAVIKIDEYEQGYFDIFRLYRNVLISEALEEIRSDQQNDRDGKVYDKIDILTKQQEILLANTVCIKCNFVFPEKYHICPNCRHDHKYHLIGYDPYSHTTSKHLENSPKVSVGEPCLVNPNNEGNVSKVLNHLKNTCDIPNERKWVVVWSDGIPYLYGMRLQQYVYCCSSCGDLVDTRTESFEDHIAKRNHESDCFIKNFRQFIFRPGPGHIELNMAKCLFHFCWPVLSSLVKILGFRTKKAQDVVQRGTNHHRSKQILFTFFSSILKELLVAYIRSLPADAVVSTQNYHNWVQNTMLSPNYMFLHDMCLTFLMAFKMYNEAIRKNNHDNMMASRIFFAPLFFAGSHPKYQELHVRDLLDRVQYPPELTCEMNKTESFSVSGINYKGQGADFIHEEKNKFIKSFLPPGVPTGDVWQRVCRKSEMLKCLKDNSIDLPSREDATSSTRRPRFDREELMMRQELRQYLSNAPVLTHVSMNNESLDPKLHYVKQTGRENYYKYKQHLSISGQFSGAKLSPVFIYKSERDDYERVDSRTKEELYVMIQNLIDTMPDVNKQALFMSQLPKSHRSLKKTQLVQLYYEISQDLEEQLVQETVPDDIEESLEVLGDISDVS